MSLFGKDLFGDDITQPTNSPVSEKFTLPPFSALDARSGPWQERKAAWISLGIKSEVGRKDDLVYSGAVKSFDAYRRQENPDAPSSGFSGTSIFDPVVAELVVRWFSPVGGQVVDPFAGGSVRGIVAGYLGRNYWGVDLRQEQVDANREQAEVIKPSVTPHWVCGDCLDALDAAPPADLILSCPPYGDLEKYSDDPRDLSNMRPESFLLTYHRAIARVVQVMRQDSFACFVVGDYRGPDGLYRNFVGQTVAGFHEAGARLYNDAVLLTVIGTNAMRITKQFIAGRKFGKTHQNVLIFVKGDWRRAVAKLGPVIA